ncbi:MAG TPA: hypothetical protein P5277_01760 [Candidatus Paceibacterota bacterium]|nr:hypothetical protein [Candidatus Paceibacterota bacterium]
MDQQRKLEILVQCDFSEWREWKRIEQRGGDVSKAHGFGNVFFGVCGALSNLADNLAEINNTYSSKDNLELVMFGYRLLSDKYSTIPFSEMEPSDEDFKFLFDYKEKLDMFGEKIQAFTQRLKAENMNGSREWPEYIQMEEILKDLAQRDYRKTILQKHGIALD